MSDRFPRYIKREYYEIQTIGRFRGWQLRRHILALWIERLACRVRGQHTLRWEPDWKDLYCENCGILEGPQYENLILGALRASDADLTSD